MLIPADVCQLSSADLLADTWLILAPAFMLWKMKLPRSSHRLILAIFTCGIFNTVASIAHTVFILGGDQNQVVTTGHVQVFF